MIYVEIRDIGMYISPIGVAPFRTPASLKISLTQVSQFITEILKAGCKDFTLSTRSIITNQVDEHVKIQPPVITTLEATVDDKLHKKLESIELILHKIMEKEPTVITNLVNSGSINKETLKDLDEDDEIFIPSFKMPQGMTISNLSSQSTVSESNMDMDRIAEELANI